MWREHGKENINEARKEVWVQSIRVCIDYINKGRELVEILKQGLDMITFVFIKIIRLNKENTLVETYWQ